MADFPLFIGLWLVSQDYELLDGINHQKGSEHMKTTTLTYCDECKRDFTPGEKVWFAWIESRCFCSTCKNHLQIQDWEPRMVPDGGE